MSPIIEIQGLGKKYKLAETQRYLALRDVISNAGKHLFSKAKKEKEFWALQDINFNIQPGERVGIIGRNGAGKSTLLKILSKITPPTTGNIKLRGRVASLLEVGTGFHPELTGRENIFLNGAILGLSKKEIQQKLEEIIDFSGVEKFIDMPLKHYSSGMQLRLAFSVAAHLEPEILLIDEVLAVGDMEFQKKCLGKMEEVSKQHGRTILFVSHNMGAIQSLCNKTLYLSNGTIQYFDTTYTVIEKYLNEISLISNNSKSYGNGKAKIISCCLESNASSVADALLGYPITLKTIFKANERLQGIEVAFNIKNIYGEIVTHSTTLDNRLQLQADENETIAIKANMSSLNMTPGPYSLDIFILNNDEMCHAFTDYFEFNVLNSNKVLRPDGFPSHVRMFTDTNWKIE